MGKTIWIVNYYYGRPEIVDNPRYLEFANYFMSAGYECVFFNSSITAKIDFKGKYKDEWYGQYHFMHIKVPRYGSMVRRVWSLLAFALRIYYHRKQFPKPDVILHNVHPPFDYPILWTAKSLGAKYVTEAWDMWPENFVTFGLLKAGNPFMKFAYYIERKLYEKADNVVFTFEGGQDYLRKKSWTTEKGGKIDLEKTYYINNGVNLEKFDYDSKLHPRYDADLNDPSIYKIIYLIS